MRRRYEGPAGHCRGSGVGVSGKGDSHGHTALHLRQGAAAGHGADPVSDCPAGYRDARDGWDRRGQADSGAGARHTDRLRLRGGEPGV